jgi:uncharacterized protein (TIGR02246 family)
MTDGIETSDHREVRLAYEDLMSAFASGDTAAYFAGFHEAASFIFPGEQLLESRSAYRTAWSRWHDDGVRFTDVVADDVRVRLFGETAVVTHRIATTVTSGGEVSVERERESIIFVRQGGRWLAVHEHLSPSHE